MPVVKQMRGLFQGSDFVGNAEDALPAQGVQRLIPTYRPCVHSPRSCSSRDSMWEFMQCFLRVLRSLLNIAVWKVGRWEILNSYIIELLWRVSNSTVTGTWSCILHSLWQIRYVTHLPFQIKSTFCSVGSFLCNELCGTEDSSLFCCPPTILLNSFGVTISV